MSAFNRILDKIMFYMMATCQAALVGLCVFQVISRYVFNNSFIWVEEISILILVWGVWITACLATRKAAHLRIALVDDYLGPRVNLVIRIILNCLGTVYFIAVFFSSRTVLDAMSFITFASLPSVPLAVTYASATFGSLMLVYYLIRLLAEDFLRLSASAEKKG